MASSSRSRSRSRSDHPQERHVMHVQSDMAGVLIGKGGETINVLCRDTGATIHVAREDGGSAERTVTIKGTADAVAKAVKAVEEIIGREKFEKGSRRSDDEEEKKVMYVSGAFVGMIIGKGGECVKAMTRDTGARIEVSKGAGDRDADRTVTILGTRNAVKKASRMIEEIVARSEEEMHFMSQVPRRALEIPLGFEECEHEEWLYNSTTQEYFSKKSGALAWLNESTGIFCPIREGVKHQDVQVVSAGTFVLTAADQSAGAVLPKTVMIPDLHRVATAMKLPLDHVDQPCAMIAVFGEPTAARIFHEKLLRRISSWRSAWIDQAWLVALHGAILDSTPGTSTPPTPAPMAVALQLGHKVVAMASEGTRLCLSADGQQLPLQEGLAVGFSGSFALLHRGSEEVPMVSSISMALITGSTPPSIEGAVSRSLQQGRPRAAALHLARAVREAGASGHLATACGRLSFSEEEHSEEKKIEKKPKLEEKLHLNKVRVRQILIRFWSGKGPYPMNPVARKPVMRKLDEAELMMLDILEKLLAQNCQNFAAICKSSSECASALKGGADNGDLGWLDHAKVAALAKAKGQPTGPQSVVQSSVPVAVVKAAFALKKGELSDVVVSEMGVHLVQRTG